MPATGDLVVPPGPGHRQELIVPAAELDERFSHASGPGGQGVNTADSRVELRLNVADSTLRDVLSEAQFARLIRQLGPRLRDGTVSVVAAEQRSQYQNRAAARERLTRLLQDGLRPPAPERRATKPSRAARQRRLDAKKQRSSVKQGRGRIRPD